MLSPGLPRGSRPHALWGAALLALLTLSARPGTAQSLTHVGQDAYKSTQQDVQLLDAWQDATSDGFFDARPRDVLVTVLTRGEGQLQKETQLLLHGAWGWFHLDFLEESFETVDDVTRHHATAWLRLDIDGDDENEIVLIERRLVASRQLDESGFVVSDAPLLTSYSLTVKYLDRSDDSLLQHEVPRDPNDPAFSLLLQTELGGPVHAALQLAAAEFEFQNQMYAKARYRLLTVKEWAERDLSARARDDLSVDMELHQASVDDPSTAWIVALRRHASLPPFYRRSR